MRRRSVLALLVVTALGSVACKKKPAEGVRCANCGMVVKGDSAFRVTATLADGTKATFDSPRCAFEARNAKKVAIASMEMQEFYDRTLLAPSALRFVSGSDVLGPMGQDVIPVSAAHEAKFMKDHKGKHAYGEAELTDKVLEHLGEDP